MSTFQWTDLWSFFAGVGGLATAIIAYLAYRQLEAMKTSIDDAKNQNKINSAFSYLPKSHEFNEIEQFLNASFIKLIDRTSKLTDAEVAQLFEETPEANEVKIKLKNYLNLLEGFCTAVEMGAVDPDAAKAMYCYKFARHYEEMLPYISEVRTKLNAPEIFTSFERVVNSWKTNESPAKKY